MLQNQIIRQSKFEVQEFDGGFAVFLATYETVKHVKTGAVDHQIISNKRISRVFPHKVPAYRRMALVMDSAPFNNFRKSQ